MLDGFGLGRASGDSSPTTFWRKVTVSSLSSAKVMHARHVNNSYCAVTLIPKWPKAPAPPLQGYLFTL
jgi:hypothetical protein